MSARRFEIMAWLFGLMCLLLVMVMVVGAESSTPPPRPVPPTIFTYGFPPGPEMGGEPAACAGVEGCGVMCYVVNEGAGQYELACVPFVYGGGGK